MQCYISVKTDVGVDKSKVKISSGQERLAASRGYFSGQVRIIITSIGSIGFSIYLPTYLPSNVLLLLLLVFFRYHHLFGLANFQLFFPFPWNFIRTVQFHLCNKLNYVSSKKGLCGSLLVCQQNRSHWLLLH